MTQVLLVSEHVLLRQALARILAMEDLFTVDEAASEREMFEAIGARTPDIVLLHIGSGAASGLQTLQELKTRATDVPVMVMLDSADDALMTLAMQAGAAGCIDASEDLTQLMTELHDAARGDIALSKSMARLLSKLLIGSGNGKTKLQLLEIPTSRELEVLEFMSLGLTNGGIAQRLNVSENTVRAHIRTISQKLGARNRVQAVARALSLGMINSPVNSD